MSEAIGLKYGLPLPFPWEAIAESLPEGVEPLAACSTCDRMVRENEDVYTDGESYYCRRCFVNLLADAETQAAIFAEAQCRITRPLPEYDPDEEFRCTPEEYENGDKASKTPNAHLCHCRHNGTNYDDLIRELDRSSATDQVV